MKQNQPQDQRLKAFTAAENHQQQQQQPPQKCPRCESLNTKFCYYNNYSLSQPRYFCKTCRRYWTQGGTLRNVPIGGGCRKGKRAKVSSSSSCSGDNSRSHAPHIPPLHVAQTQQNMIPSNPMISVSDAFRTKESGSLASSSVIPSIGSYYPGAGFLSSLAGIQSMNQTQPQPFNQPLNQSISIGGGGSSNLGILQGYGVPSFGSQQQPVQQTQFFPMGDNRDQKPNLYMYPSDQQERLIQSNRFAASDSAQPNWHHQSFVNNSDPTTVSETVMWSMNNNNNSSSSTSSAGQTNTNNTTGGSLNPNQWTDLPDYGAPP